MKIYYLCPDLGISVDGQKGASSHIRGFVNALKNQGHEITLITSVAAKQCALDVPMIVIPPPPFIEEFIGETNSRPFRALRHVFYNASIDHLLKELVAVERPDFIYERYSPFSAAGAIFCRKHQLPHVLEVNAPLADQGQKYRKQALQDACEFLEKTAFTQSGLLITLTEELKQWLISEGAPKDKVKVRPSGVDETLFIQDGPSYKSRFGEKIVLGFVGSLKPWHDIELLTHLFRALRQDPKYHLLVVGDGPMRRLVEPLAEESPDRVTLTGAIEQEEVPQYLRAVDIALAPYPEMDLFYFSPLKVYEYMAMGKAVIATKIGQLQTLIQDGENGRLVNLGDLQGWINAISHLAENKSQRHALGARAAQDMHQHHTWKKRAEQFMEIVNPYLVGG